VPFKRPEEKPGGLVVGLVVGHISPIVINPGVVYNDPYIPIRSMNGIFAYMKTIKIQLLM